jgi:hypothetical protein
MINENTTVTIQLSDTSKLNHAKSVLESADSEDNTDMTKN